MAPSVLSLFFMLELLLSITICCSFNQFQKPGGHKVKAHAHAGLLTGLNSFESSLFYTQELNLVKAAELAADKKYLCQSAELDAAECGLKFDDYIAKLQKASDNFIFSDERWDREELVDCIEDIIARRGKFCCLLGGKSTGKTFVLNSLISDPKNRNVILINLRKHKNILSGLKYALNERKSNLRRGTDAITSIITAGLSSVNLSFDSKAFLKILMDANPDVILGDIVSELVKNVGPVTLIIDEANAEFSNEPEKRVESQDALRLFTCLTKKERLVSLEFKHPNFD